MLSAFVLGGPGISIGRDALDWARQSAVDGVELWVVDNDLDPHALTPSGRQDLAYALIRSGLRCAALRCDLGGFHEPRNVDERVARTMAAMDLARDLAAPRIVVAVDTIPDNAAGRAYRGQVEALAVLAAYGAERGAAMTVLSASRTEDLLPILLTNAESGIGIAYDPAAQFRMDRDAAAGLETIAHWIRHLYWRDADRREGDDDWIYWETVAGKGRVPLKECWAILAQNNFEGFVSIDRARCATRADDMIAGLRHFTNIRDAARRVSSTHR